MSLNLSTKEQPAFLRQMEICERLGISDETWRRWRASGVAPRPVNLPGRKRWRLEDIEAFERVGQQRSFTRHLRRA